MNRKNYYLFFHLLPREEILDQSLETRKCREKPNFVKLYRVYLEKYRNVTVLFTSFYYFAPGHLLPGDNPEILEHEH